jgi:hypothetical protein
MIRSALLLCAGIIIAACFACAPVPPPSLSAAAAREECTADTFLGKVEILSTSFMPMPGETAPDAPKITKDSQYYDGLKGAFDTASRPFQQQLCALDRVYVYEAGCTDNGHECPGFGDSWGWLQSSNKLGQGWIVAISSGMWAYATDPMPYSHYETDLMHSVMGLDGAYYWGAFSCVAPGSCRNIDTLPLALMGALAHEIGHILWYEKLGESPNDFCNGGFFPLSWVTPVHPAPLDSNGHRWRHFLSPTERGKLKNTGRWLDSHKRWPHVTDIDNSRNRYYTAYLIEQLFTPTEPWASAFAAVSPDEDFVETYKFKVLTTANPPLTSVTITLPTHGVPSYVNVARDYADGKKSDLSAKVACIPDSF